MDDIQKPIGSKQEFRKRLAKDLGFLPGPPLKGGGTILVGYHKPITTKDGTKGLARIIFQNLGFNPEDLRIMVGADLYSDGRSAWSNNNEFLSMAAKFLNKPMDDFLRTDLHISNPNSPSIKSPILQELHDKIHSKEKEISTLDMYEKTKALISELEEKGYFVDRLEKLVNNYKSGLKVKEEITKRMKQLLSQFKHILDEYDERETIVFYTDPIKGKMRVPTIEFHIRHIRKDSITILIGKAKMENGVLVQNPSKKSWYKYFYKNYPYYLYSNDLHTSVDSWGKKVEQKIIWWEYKDLNDAFIELKKFVAGK